MSVEDITTTSRDRSVKTLAIRLEPEQHATLSLIAQLRDSTITDEIRTALLTHIESIKTQPELAAKAGDVLEAIEREAATRRDAIASLFGTARTPAAESPATAQFGSSNGTNGMSETNGADVTDGSTGSPDSRLSSTGRKTRTRSDA